MFSPNQALPYTSSPAGLALQDFLLFLRITFTWPIPAGLPSIILPFYPYRSGRYDELYPSFQNIKALSLHLFLILTQTSFLLLLIPSLFFGIPLPLFGWTPTCILLVIGFVVGNDYFCILLNGTKRRYDSIERPEWKPHADEKWVFINGVAVGDHWMQSNLDRLALTFRRPIHGIHNKTRGIIFDVVETIIQRTFGYATPDIREVYADVVRFIEEEKGQLERYNKIVLILHSQGAVEGGLVLDWLFASTSRELLEKVEVYTFGSAANHFNSPEMKEGRRVVRYIEHYANLSDYVSLFGILYFRPLPSKAGLLRRKQSEGAREAQAEIENRYVGRLFVRKGSGHQMNGNYLDNFFEMDMDEKTEALIEVKEENAYMEGVLNEALLEDFEIVGRLDERDVWNCRQLDSGNEGVEQAKEKVRKIKDVSRLWRYRNGLSPED